MATNLKRCSWSGDDPLYVEYHDKEWGVPVHDDRKLFEFLILEGMQAGLSWLTILRKRENFRRALAGFDAEKVARFGKRDIARLMADAGIVRHQQKILAAVTNAQGGQGQLKRCGAVAGGHRMRRPTMGSKLVLELSYLRSTSGYPTSAYGLGYRLSLKLT